jgi:hypothetical protein
MFLPEAKEGITRKNRLVRSIETHVVKKSFPLGRPGTGRHLLMGPPLMAWCGYQRQRKV